ncbi:MAG: class I SAM-dependent methyltransferase [Candidatus Roseilinea sp.]|uniref:class I SAM-dependent methyltransferase n=1 Tax=Candidatus Roseilinea sp. TaxID=2838777 RepID=UPI00404ADB3D
MVRDTLIVLSYVQIEPALAARRSGQSRIALSLDLGLSATEAALDDEGLVLPGGLCLSWARAEEIAASRSSCFVVEASGGLRKVQAFSPLTQRHYSLYPTTGAPTMLVSGLPMHRIKGTDPQRDTQSKIKAASLTRGRALDTCTGLGYTAIEAAKVAGEVVTVELDPTAQEIARQNPWSQALFHNPRIRQIIGDSFEQIAQFEDESFARIIHDPPTFALAGDLYSIEFYRHMWRVLKPGGRVFHYIGDLDSKSGGRVARGVMERLQQAGFTRVIPRNEAFGVIAIKG